MGGRGALPGRGGLIAGAQPTRLWASADVTVDGRNVSNIVLALQQGMSVSGRLVFEGTTPPPTDLTRVRVSLSPIASPGTPNEVMMSASGTADADGRDEAGRAECRWQRDQLPGAIRDLVLDDQRLRNALCWFAFDG